MARTVRKHRITGTNERRARFAAYRAELDQLAARNRGMLPPPTRIVEFARDPKTALHHWFCWDDTEAAERYRIEQARRLVQVTFTVIAVRDVQVKVRTFISLPSDRQGQHGYRRVEYVMKNRGAGSEYLRSLLAELDVMIVKYRKYAGLSTVLDELAAVLARERGDGGAAIYQESEAAD